MAIKYQFNKISMQYIRKQLKIRQTALPTIKSKESALRLTVKKQKEILKRLTGKFDERIYSLSNIMRLWGEFPEEIFSLKEVILNVKKIAGVKTPELEKIDYEIKSFSRFINPVWLNTGILLLKELTEIITQLEIAKRKLIILEYARKKTTQKVNLYEKVQIPEFSDAILKIKRYLEDVDNLEKAGQKISKQRQAAQGGNS
ncbi:MAG: V-type ATP synthase subunit D [Spirochaetes bacterium GWF1_31_7]|nr:MAG: V-type ATP synthase subunit D [Spirochaetes bacterium GWE1_32_154]OHD50105.1 MAG: V-type ATP synthase subunit D [Spirochaetes bacterium GWE2_31_10]OHD52418.1 MAG: V-type ATP synthase subunit D [Spirochaetes bacterium GWF1_31_7]OHD73784.1 MAG: V-type ATP synthase subunit D [Spirochaetes bacterium RIFOXYB1_FULL_32_8]HBD96062.1 V-type ATP synthase subunit D [Spirochaetia bacterium]